MWHLKSRAIRKEVFVSKKMKSSEEGEESWSLLVFLCVRHCAGHLHNHIPLWWSEQTYGTFPQLLGSLSHLCFPGNKWWKIWKRIQDGDWVPQMGGNVSLSLSRKTRIKRMDILTTIYHGTWHRGTKGLGEGGTSSRPDRGVCGG